MKMLKSIIILNLLLFGFIFADGAIKIGSSSPFIYFHNFQFESQNSLGFSNITEAQVLELGSSNPASLTRFNSMSTGIGFEYANNIDYYDNMELGKAKQWIPATAGIVFPVGHLNVGIAYFKK